MYMVKCIDICSRQTLTFTFRFDHWLSTHNKSKGLSSSALHDSGTYPTFMARVWVPHSCTSVCYPGSSQRGRKAGSLVKREMGGKGSLVGWIKGKLDSQLAKASIRFVCKIKRLCIILWKRDTQSIREFNAWPFVC